RPLAGGGRRQGGAPGEGARGDEGAGTHREGQRRSVVEGGIGANRAETRLADLGGIVEPARHAGPGRVVQEGREIVLGRGGTSTAEAEDPRGRVPGGRQHDQQRPPSQERAQAGAAAGRGGGGAARDAD